MSKILGAYVQIICESLLSALDYPYNWELISYKNSLWFAAPLMLVAYTLTVTIHTC